MKKYQIKFLKKGVLNWNSFLFQKEISLKYPFEFRSVDINLITVDEIDSEVLKFRESKSWFMKTRFFFLLMEEITSVSIVTVAIVKEGAALFCFVFEVGFVVFSQFVWSVGEFAAWIIGTKSTLHEFSA